MIKNKKSFLCVIPARGGSKGIPNKNIIDLCGHPLIYYIIKAVKESNIFDKIIISTDSNEIKKVCEECEINIPFLRPKELGLDDSLVEDTVFHALKYIKKNDKEYDYVCLTQPTSPLINAVDFKEAKKKLIGKKADMVISVNETLENIAWTGKLSNNLSMKNFCQEKTYRNRRQDFKKNYILNGAFYLGRWDIFYNRKNYYKQKTYAHVIPQERSWDIDSYFDLKIVKLLLKDKKGE